jgi:deoxyribose-phosphate aldolase
VAVSSALLDDLVDAVVSQVRQRASTAGPGDALQKVQWERGWNSNAKLISPHVIAAAGRSDQRVARRIDHTLLKPEATREQLVKLCQEARQYNFFSVCVNSSNVALSVELLAGSSTVCICVVGFPLGACLPQVKAYEAQEAIKLGAKEIDTVINIGALKSGDFQAVYEDLAMTVQAAHPIPVKVILETSKLTNEEKVAGCVLSKKANAAFVKTSTGFGGGGATIEDVKLMKSIVGSAGIQVKASGGVRTSEDAWAMIEAGADRLGASSSVAVVTGGVGAAGY